MRRIAILLSTLLLAVSFSMPFAGAAEWNETMAAGEVLYRQSFADLFHYEKSGFRTGTSTSEGAAVEIRDGALQIRVLDGGRAYVMMPAVTRGPSYTAEFTFRFTQSGMENGSLSFLVTCRGEEPTNITSLVIRSDGTVDDFPAPSEEVSAAIRGGKTVTVEIPVEEGAVHRMKLTAGDASCTLERSDVLMINQGTMGFSVRNDGVAVTDVWVMNGCGYESKTGSTASAAREDPEPVKEAPPGKSGSGAAVETGETAPKTGEKPRFKIYQQVAAVTGAGAVVLSCGLSRRRKLRRGQD